MRTEIINVELIVEVVNPHLYNEYNGELQRVCDDAIKQGVMNYVNTNRRIVQAFDIMYSPIVDRTSPNLKFKVTFKAERKKFNFDGIGEYIEFEEIPADGDNKIINNAKNKLVKKRK